jgi:uncharacterized protein
MMIAMSLQLAWAGLQEGYDAFSRGEYEAAIKEWRPLAERGNAEAQYNMGVLFDTGRGVPQDDNESVHWYKRAAAQGYANAQGNLGLMYNKGRGVPQDRHEGLRWYHLAAEQGNSLAQFNIGQLYDSGPQDFKEARLVPGKRYGDCSSR